jgi:hypothetical protein
MIDTRRCRSAATAKQRAEYIGAMKSLHWRSNTDGVTILSIRCQHSMRFVMSGRCQLIGKGTAHASAGSVIRKQSDCANWQLDTFLILVR